MLAGRLGTIELGKSVAQRIPPWLNRSSWPLAADRLRCKALARRCCLVRGSSKRQASRSIELAHRCKALACRGWLARCRSKRQASRSSWAKPSWSERALVQVAERIAFSQTRWAISLLAAGCWLLAAGCWLLAGRAGLRNPKDCEAPQGLFVERARRLVVPAGRAGTIGWSSWLVELARFGRRALSGPAQRPG